MIDRLLLDMSYALALANTRDQFHARAIALMPRFEKAQVWVTETVLTEIADGLASINREAAVSFIRRVIASRDSRVVGVDTELFRDGLDLYSDRPDKQWSLTDCISFILMARHGLTAALTSDRHFLQAGFRALMLEET